MATAMASIYRPLDHCIREIRLLRLQPAPFDAKIECQLLYTSLDDPCPYEVLSYRWGAIEFSEDIHLDGQPFCITGNLAAALRHLRDGASGERTLWVDAVCINQEDTLERNRQVSLMRDIYARCTTDLAWLGPNPGSQGQDGAREERPGDSKLSSGLELMRKIAERDENTLRLLRHGDATRSYDGEPFELDYSEQDLLDAVFLEAPLWKRVWVMQELSCAPRVVLVAGKSTLEWDLVANFLGDTPYSDAFHVVFDHGDRAGPEEAVLYYFEIAQAILHQRGLVKDVATGSHSSTLMDVLARFKFASSTDPRDKIFGLLGLVSEDHNIKVDYNKTVAQVFVETCTSFIDASRNLDIICQSPWQAGEKDVLEKRQTRHLPSWVADFQSDTYSGLKDSFSALLFAQRGIFSAGTETCQTPCQVVSESSNALLVEAIFIDTIGEILQPDYFSDTNDLDIPPPSRDYWWTSGPGAGTVQATIKEWVELYLRAPSENERGASWNLSPYEATGEPLIQAYWRTLLMDCKAYPIERLDENQIAASGPLFTQLLLSQPSPGSEEETEPWNTPSSGLPDEEARWLGRHGLRWTFITSASGLFCMIKKGAREGDVIAVLDGGKVPVILRPVDGDDSRFHVVTTAYVHGYMDGEAMVGVENGKLQRRDLFLV